VSGGAFGEPLGLDATHVYWKTENRVNKIAKVAGAATTIGTVTPAGISASLQLGNGNGRILVQDADSVYFPGYNTNSAKDGQSASVYRLSKGDGTRTAVATGAAFSLPFVFTIDGPTIYWIDSSFKARKAVL
jgi:hypothetical protein